MEGENFLTVSASASAQGVNAKNPFDKVHATVRY